MTQRAPTRFRCKVGGEWKNLSEFSNAQQRNLQTGRVVDPAHSGMTCKQHASGSRSELRCELCNLVKPLDEFSKSSRRKGEYQCRRCVAWIEIQEPTLTPGPLETGHISPEEEEQQMLKNRFLLSNDFFDGEDEGLPQAPVTAFSSLGLDESYATAVGSTSIGELLSRFDDTYSTRSNMPPHLEGKAAASAAASETSSVAGSSSEVTLPPHLRGKYKTMSAAASSAASSTAGDLSLPTTLLDTDSDVASIVNNFNAWGPNGELQRRRPDSVLDSAASLSSEAVSAENNDPNVVGDWTRVGKPKSAVLSRPGKGRFVKDAEARMSSAEMREYRGEIQPTYMRREIDTQKRIRPIGYDSDSE
ncbi:hypothetical protein LMH87_011737 [Akanthomyces muscarius]|uniref:Stc1 domain-containing protein n=1 Tax=Akanthomyces muscarius TaxID=2231603 RepID=A0A9W8Q9R6_AKAMU|nr:hypothetical protein LMH87_011737 [Akanthomyces muscarius]KAJ4151017.1 hypothetical protein LMH87_011737 [Akanthomyces muscarius]